MSLVAPHLSPEAPNHDPLFDVGETVAYPKRQWWSLWLYQRIVLGRITERHDSYKPEPCLCWLYKIDGIDKWCTQGYLLDYNPRGRTPVSLLPKEQEVMDALVFAWNAFTALPVQHDDDIDDFRRSIHEAQRIMGQRTLRRDYPEEY